MSRATPIGDERLSSDATFLHLSDLHLAPPGERVNGVDPRHQVQRVLSRLRDMDVGPAFIIVSGDLSNDGTAASYELLTRLLPELAGGETPVLLALGNHDDRATFRRVVLGQDDGDEGPYHSCQPIDGLQVVVLDSMIPGEEGGAVGTAQLAWLEEQLRTPAPLGTIIVLHHCCRLAAPPSTVARFVLRDVDALEAVVARHRVLGVLAGHSHQANAASFAGALYATAPAVLCQLDYFSGEELKVVAGSGFNIGQIRDGQLTVHPVLLDD